MELLKLHTKLSKADLQSLKLISLSLLLVLFHQTYSMLLFPSSSIFVNLGIIGLGVLGCFLFLSRHSLISYTRWFLYLIFYFIVVGFLQGFGNLPIVLGQDLRYVLLFFIGGVFASNADTMSYFHWLMKWLGVISIVFGILGLVYFDITEIAITERSGTWTISYFYWWASCACFSYWGYYALFTKKQKFLGLAVLLVYLILGALFVKRASLVNGLVIMIVYLIFDKGVKIGSYIKVLLLLASTVLLLYFIAPGVFKTITDSYTTRIEQATEDIDELDRNREANAYFESASTSQLVFGNGIGHYTEYSGAINKDSFTMNSLHLGWANIIYKGGVFYVLFYVFILVAVLRKCFKAKKLNPYQLTCLGVSISSFISLLYEGSWTYTLLPVCISAPMFYLLSNNKNEIN